MRGRPVRSLVLVLLAGVVGRASQVGALADAGPHGPATATGTPRRPCPTCRAAAGSMRPVIG
jgi:hypothetical protein